eukprot:1580127-Rhodomonas_salina.2
MRTTVTVQFGGTLMSRLELQRTKKKGSTLTAQLPSQQALQTMSAALNKLGWHLGADSSRGPALHRNSGWKQLTMSSTLHQNPSRIEGNTGYASSLMDSAQSSIDGCSPRKQMTGHDAGGT